jgi:hypothetical protein
MINSFVNALCYLGKCDVIFACAYYVVGGHTHTHIYIYIYIYISAGGTYTLIPST